MNFIANLHGASNTVRPKETNAKFNHYLSAKSLVLYDEVNLSLNSKEAFKRIANRELQTERKGEDQRDTINFASICLATNYVYNLPMDPQDRRFSFPDITSGKLENALGSENTDRLFEIANDQHVLKAFYNNLKAMWDKRTSADNVRYGATVPLKDTNSFEQCCLANAPIEIDFLYDLFRKKGMDNKPAIKEIEFEELRKKYKMCLKTNSGGLRIGKNSLMFSAKAYIKTASTYNVDGKPMVKVDYGSHVIRNNINV